MSRGSALSAEGSTMMCARSTDCMPSFSDSASRSVASDTNPSCTSRRPTGTCDLVCSSSAILSWSSVRMPWSIRIWPMWRLAWGLAGAFILNCRSLPLVAELGGADAGGGDIEAGRALLRERDGPAVVIQRELGLAQVIEADRQIEREVGVVGLRGKRLEVLLLCFGPAALLRELVAEGEMQHVGARIGGEEVAHAALGGERVEAARAQGEEAGLRVRIVGVGGEQAQIGRFRRLVSLRAHVERRKPQQGVAVARIVAQRFLVVGASGGEVAGEVRG